MKTDTGRNYLLFFMIIAVAVLLRVPGLFWGMGAGQSYSYEENKIITSACSLSRGGAFAEDVLPGALIPLAGIIKMFGYGSNGQLSNILFAGRIISLVFSVAAIVALFLIARLIFSDKRIAPAAAFLLSCSVLHVTYGHLLLTEGFTAAVFYLSAYFVLVSVG